MSTSYEAKISILSDVWVHHRTDEDFEDLIAYNDIGFPLAYLLHNNIAVEAKESARYINETFDFLLDELEVNKEIEYENLEHLLDEFGDEGLIGEIND